MYYSGTYACIQIAVHILKIYKFPKSELTYFGDSALQLGYLYSSFSFNMIQLLPYADQCTPLQHNSIEHIVYVHTYALLEGVITVHYVL